MSRVRGAFRCVLLGCWGVSSFACGAQGVGRGDRIVEAGGEVAGWATAADGSVSVPLLRGLHWRDVGSPASADALLRWRADEGPTYIVVAFVGGARGAIEPTPATCAEGHRTKLAVAAATAGVPMTPPNVSSRMRKGESVPRVDYAVALDAKGGARPASTLSSWVYFVVGGRCLGISVTGVVRSKVADVTSPDAEDLRRLEQVFEAVADGAKVRGGR